MNFWWEKVIEGSDVFSIYEWQEQFNARHVSGTSHINYYWNVQMLNTKNKIVVQNILPIWYVIRTLADALQMQADNINVSDKPVLWVT
jgi:hypothetical protein